MGNEKSCDLTGTGENECSPDEKREKDILLTSPTCPHCEQAKRILRSKIESGEIEVMSTDTERGIELASKLELRAVPRLLHEEGGEIDVCQITTTGKALCKSGRVLNFGDENSKDVQPEGYQE